MRTLRLFLLAGMAGIAILACQKETLPVEDNSLVTEQETMAEEIMNDLDALVDEAVNSQMNSLKSASLGRADYLGECPVVTVDKSVTPMVMTIDFGTECKGEDGKTRSGKIIVTSTTFRNVNSERTKTFDNFYVEGKKIEGTVTRGITVNKEEHLRVAQVNEDVTIIFPNDGGTAIRKANLTREYQLNILVDKNDNIISSWGSVEFTRVDGVVVKKVIEEADPLVFKVSCHRIVSGTVTCTITDKRTWSIDYGDGECDNLATMTSGDVTKIIHLR